MRGTVVIQRASSASSQIVMGRPIGGCRSTMPPALARAAALAAALAVAAAMVLATTMPALASSVDVDGGFAGQLHWAVAGTSNDLGTGQLELWWVLEDDAGEWVESITSGGSTTWGNHSTYGHPSDKPAKGYWIKTRVTRTEDITQGNLKAYAPTEDQTRNILGAALVPYVNHAAADTSAVDSTIGAITDPEPSHDGDLDWNSPMATTEVTVDITHLTNLWPSALKMLYTSVIMPICRIAAGIIQWLLSIVDPSELFPADFETGTYAELYRMAEKISSQVAVPYARTFLGIAFVVSLLDPARPKAHDGTPEWLDGFMRRIAFFMLAWVLIDNALTVIEWAYWLGSRAIQAVCGIVGAVSGFSAMGQAILAQVSERLEALTFNQFFLSVVFVFILGTTVATVFRCVLKILTVSILRTGEIYLRASMAAVPFAFFVGDRQRQVGINYMKRFLAVSFQAVVMVIALSFMGTIYSAAATVVSALVAGSAPAGVAGIELVADLAQTVLPMLVAIGCATAIIDKTDAIASSMFGL